jgi:2-dehydro-3-deoxygalactonokinase
MEFGHADPLAFEAGVRLGLAEHASASHVIFAARTAGLMGTVSPRGLPDYLSGILVGIEIAGATRRGKPQSVTVLGDEALAARYEAALKVAGIGCKRAPDEATTQGQWLVAQRARLVERR